MRGKLLFAVLLAAALCLAGLAHAEQAGKPTIAQPCTACHQAQDKVLRGNFVNASMKAETVQMQIGPATYLVRFDDQTKIMGAEAPNKIPVEKEIAITYEEKAGELYAKQISVKPPARIAPEKLISTEQVAELVAMGPEKGNYVLIDSRPAPRYNEGHIPTAVNMPLPAFDKMKDTVLPADRGRLVIFYCGGVT
jgi:hypothetical protein